jgi:hypothetical protein
MTNNIHLHGTIDIASGDADQADSDAGWQAITPAAIAFGPAFPFATPTAPVAALSFSASSPATNTFTVGSIGEGAAPSSQAAVSTMADSIGTDGSPAIVASSQNAQSVHSTNAIVPVTTPTGLVINVSYDTSVTNLAASDPTLEADFMSAVQTAVQFYEREITNSITVNIKFGWGEYAGIPVTGVSTNKTSVFDFNYSDIYSALQAIDTTSDVQKAALATLSATDPTHGATFSVTTAEGKALGLNLFFTGTDGSVGLNSSDAYSWTAGSTAAGTYDAVGALEHEISEVLGRVSTLGANNTYMPLDLFRYTAQDGGANDSEGSATGVRDEPFVAGYNSNAQGYFSYDGKTVTDPFDTPAHVAAGADPGDWSNTVAGDSYGYAVLGESLPVTSTDLEVMNVLGYDLAAVACFAGGTQIATSDGEVPVECLLPGATLRSVFGGDARVTWVGHRRIDCSRHPTPELVWPVRIAAGAFEPGSPRRDLYLSPDHAVYVSGALIPIKLLINRTTIRQIEVPSVTYYHVEVERHDVVLAEGLPAETYLDTGNRSAFDNGGGVVALHPDFAGAQKARVAGSRVALLVEPLAVEGTWRALADRSAALGWPVACPALVSDPDLHLRIGDRHHAPIIIRGDRYSFVLPTLQEPIALVSHAARPSDLRPWVDDSRRLGVMVRRLTVRNGSYQRDVALDDPALERGWWQVEWQGGGPVRWTTGEAELPVLGSCILEVELAAVMEHVADTWADQSAEMVRLAG